MKRRDAKLRPALLERLRNGGTADRIGSGDRPSAAGEHVDGMRRSEGRGLPGNWAVVAQEVGRGCCTEHEQIESSPNW